MMLVAIYRRRDLVKDELVEGTCNDSEQKAAWNQTGESQSLIDATTPAEEKVLGQDQ